MKDYDVAIIGSGPGGYIAAEYASKNGLKTLCIESNEFGGVCLNKGCIPTKTLLKSSKLLNQVANAVQFGVDGIDVKNISLNWKKIQNRKSDVVSKLVKGVESILKNAKVDTIKGNAIIKNKNELEVNGKTISFQNLIIATGSSSKKINLPGFDGAYKANKVVTSDELLNINYIPKRFTVIGGGVIGIEFAILFAELGSQVTILQNVDRILEVLDKDVSEEITKLLINKGVRIETNVSISEFKNGMVFYKKNNEMHSIKSNIVLSSIGRKPNSEIVKNIGVDIAENGSIITDEYMKTSIDNIYAIGDCTSKVMLAHSAYKNAIVAINSILNKKTKMDLNKIPSCIYTHPEVACIGKTEEQLIEEKVEYCKVKFPISHIGKALADGETVGFLKLLADKNTAEILGCHIICNNASNLISEIALSMELEATVNTLVETVHPHPSTSEVIWEAAKKMLLDNFKDKKWY